MSQLRQEDSGTIVSMLHRRTDNRSVSTITSLEDDQGQCLPHNNTNVSFELTDQLTKQPQMMTEFTEKETECSNKTVPVCPVCGKSLQWVGENEILLNRHVDECLNEVAVSDMLANEKRTSPVNR